MVKNLGSGILHLGLNPGYPTWCVTLGNLFHLSDSSVLIFEMDSVRELASLGLCENGVS